MENVRMIFKQESSQAGLCFKVNLKQLEDQSFIDDVNQSF